MQLPSSVTQMDLNRDNGLLSVICDDLAIRIVDIDTRRVVRDLRGFKGRILDTVSLIRLRETIELTRRLSRTTRDGSSRLRSTESSGRTTFRPGALSMLSERAVCVRALRSRPAAISWPPHMSTAWACTCGEFEPLQSPITNSLVGQTARSSWMLL